MFFDHDSDKFVQTRIFADNIKFLRVTCINNSQAAKDLVFWIEGDKV